MVAVAVAVIVTWTRGGTSAPSTTTTDTRAALPTAPKAATARLDVLVERKTGLLTAPVQDAAAVPLEDSAMLLGGLTAADASRDDVRLATASGDRAAGRLPAAVHDAPAVRIGGFVYVFGGGTTRARRATRSSVSRSEEVREPSSRACRRRAPTRRQR